MIDTKPALAAGPRMNIDTAQIYTDLSGVQQLKVQNKTDKAGALKNIAHQFEAMMVQMMMKSMRDANAVFADGDMTSSSDGKFYQDMFDNQLSLSLSKGRGFGIAEALMRQLQGRAGNAVDKGAALGVDSTLSSAQGINSDHNLSADRSLGSDKSLSPLQRVQSLVASAAAQANAGVENPRMTAAIQDALHALFAGAEVLAGAEVPREAQSATTVLDGTPSNFVESLRPMAKKIATALGVDSDVLLSQAALETGWGQKVIECADGSSSFNFFNIKAGDDWHGAVAKVPTIEYRDGVAVREWANFRAYNSPEESFADYARLVSESPRYQQALECADNPRAYITALAQAGYATDPRYAQKVLAVLDSEPMRAVTNDSITHSPIISHTVLAR